MEEGKHVLFYRIAKSGILIVRIRHERQMPATFTLLPEAPGS